MIKTPEIKYRRLPGKGLRKQGFIAVSRISCTLWLANDHILNVDNHVFSEDYKRFYFRDIQAIITQKTNRGKVWNIILSFFGGLFGGIALFNVKPGGTEAVVAWLIVAGIFGIFLLINWLRGPTCNCHIITAVQQEQLPSLSRLKTAKKVIRILKPFIQKAQGEFKVEEAQATIPSATTRRASNPLYLNSPVETIPPVKHYHGRMHEIVFLLLLVNALLTGIFLLYHHILLNALNWGIALALGICVIAALVKQYDTDITTGIKGMTWGTLGYVCSFYLAGYILLMAVFMQGVIQTGSTYNVNDRWEMYKAALTFSPSDSSIYLGIAFVFLVCAFLLGSIGFLLLSRFRRAYATPPPLVE
jgi:hypothetical protein